MTTTKIKLAIFLLLTSLGLAVSAQGTGGGNKEELPPLAPSYAWTLLQPLGLHEPATIDTLFTDYGQQSVPTDVSLAYATTGNLGAEGINMIFLDRKPMSDFFFRDALLAWLPMQGNHKYYNTRIPMTLVSYNFGGGRYDAQDRLSVDFSGNVNKSLQIGANLDYLYSKGSYDCQAVKDMVWGFSGSYIGDKYEMQTFFNHYNSLNKENGGITDDLYITDPAEVQGGTPTINPKSIPVRLTATHNRLAGQEFYLNNRYKIGFWETMPLDTLSQDTIPERRYVPVSSITWTLDFNSSKRTFDNTSQVEAQQFWENFYLRKDGSHDVTSYWSLRNTFGLSLHEGFHKYAKAGLAAFITQEIRKYTQAIDTIPMSGPDRPVELTPYPLTEPIAPKATENLLWIGGQLTKQNGSLLTYDVTGQIGVAGRAVGDVKIDALVSSRFKLLKDSVTISGYGNFANEAAPYLMNNFVSNHFIWHNDFGKTRRFRIGGKLDVPFSNTRINVGVENLQNYIYFNDNCLPAQHDGSIQVLSASLEQNFKVGILNWDTRLTYQTSSEQTILPLPKLAVYSNLFLLFKVATLYVQLGVDCDYYTKYKSLNYQPATMSFHTQQEVEVGGYPFMNAYANMKLGKARFYVMFSHVNQGMMGKDYFALPHYPMNPRRFQLGVSVDFAN